MTALVQFVFYRCIGLEANFREAPKLSFLSVTRNNLWKPPSRPVSVWAYQGVGQFTCLRAALAANSGLPKQARTRDVAHWKFGRVDNGCDSRVVNLLALLGKPTSPIRTDFPLEAVTIAVAHKKGRLTCQSQKIGSSSPLLEYLL